MEPNILRNQPALQVHCCYRPDLDGCAVLSSVGVGSDYPLSQPLLICRPVFGHQPRLHGGNGDSIVSVRALIQYALSEHAAKHFYGILAGVVFHECVHERSLGNGGTYRLIRE
ncbi:MAG: hypothetical protein OXF84_07170 [Bacteroidetes bacterium]|nr:hypothetical protein [Bacteroidota bacterium]